MSKTASNKTFGLFWKLIKDIPDYDEKYKEVIKEGIVSEFSEGKTTSLSEMYKRYPAQYAKMIESMKGKPEKRQERYDDGLDRDRKKVIAAVCSWLDKAGYKFDDRNKKINYAICIACRAANCSNFNQIPSSKLSAIYTLFVKKNSINLTEKELLTIGIN